jgi:hypothetical protein
MWFDVYVCFAFFVIATRNKYKYKKFYFKSGIYINNNINYNELFTNIYVVVLCLFFTFMLLCYVYVLHLCCYAMFIFCIYVVMLCLLFCIYVVMQYLFFEFMLLCYVFFRFLVACTPVPACPANYQRIGIPAGVAGAGTILQSCYRVITAAVDFRAGAVSICTCCKLCWRISKYMYCCRLCWRISKYIYLL